MRYAVLLALASLAAATSGCRTAGTSIDPALAPLVGHWRSVAFEGADKPQLLESTEFEFGADGRFLGRITLKSIGATATEETTGTYTVVKDPATGDTLLKVTDPDGIEKPPFRFWFDGDQLLMADPNLNSRIRFNRVTEQE